jgi:hypothetical protein
MRVNARQALLRPSILSIVIREALTALFLLRLACCWRLGLEGSDSVTCTLQHIYDWQAMPRVGGIMGKTKPALEETPSAGAVQSDWGSGNLY